MNRLVGSLVLVVCLVAGACSEDGGRGQSDGRRIEFAFFGDPVEAAGYVALVDAFEDAHPSIGVDAVAVPSKSDLLARLVTSFAAGDGPDVFLVNSREYGQFVASGAVSPVQPLLDASAELDEEVFFEPPLDAFRYDGEALSCMPQNVSSLVVYVNIELFRDAGIDVPRDGWTWEAFVEAARAMTDPPADTWGLVTSSDLIRIAPFVWSGGGEIVDDERSPTTLTLSTPTARDAVDDFLDLSAVEGVAPPDRADQETPPEERFLSGRAGMYLNSRRVTPTVRQEATFAWDVVPLPTRDGGGSTTILHTDAYCISASADPDLAWELVEFAMSVEGQTIVAESGRTVPSRLDVAGSSAFLDGRDPRNARVFLDNAGRARSTPTVGAWPQVEELADGILRDIWYGRLDRGPALERLERESRRLLDGS